jgi:hypothetical protein
MSHTGKRRYPEERLKAPPPKKGSNLAISSSQRAAGNEPIRPKNVVDPDNDGFNENTPPRETAPQSPKKRK